ncbi:MAG: YeeE/YedE family protein [Solirubrobacterales bacterium]|nr:YeeE/YedE family protein [Solirubrobacterales bacterium]
MLHPQLAWYVAGPTLGLCVVAMRLLLNERLGVMGAVSDVVARVSERSLAFGTRGWFLVGLVLGGLGFALVAGGPDFHGYGWLTDTFHGTAGTVAIAAILLVSGVLVGYGAKLAGGCTSGNGLSGNAMGSPASLLATATFFATAIVVAFAIEAVL